ncbi:hypothetical protein KSS87_015469, partial [Heliosperma pusillum]
PSILLERPLSFSGYSLQLLSIDREIFLSLFRWKTTNSSCFAQIYHINPLISHIRRSRMHVLRSSFSIFSDD